MAEMFADKPSEKKAPAAMEKPPELASRVISRGPAEVHGAIDTLGRSAEHMRIPSEGSYKDVATADMSMRIAKNVQALGLFENSGTSPLSERFAKMLRSV